MAVAAFAQRNRRQSSAVGLLRGLHPRHADLLYAIGGNVLWSLVRRAFEETFAECARSVDPRIDFASRDADISRAIGQSHGNGVWAAVSNGRPTRSERGSSECRDRALGSDMLPPLKDIDGKSRVLS
jgi:hypothetical protein